MRTRPFRQNKPLHDSVRAWLSDWTERKTRMAIREGWKCGYCGYTPEKQTEDIKREPLRRLTNHELLRRHMRAHLDYEDDREWEHPPGFNHQGRIKPKGSKL